jgi:hypothetical protein
LYILENSIRRDRLAEILERRGKEYKKHHARNASPLVPGALDSDEKGVWQGRKKNVEGGII